MWFRYNLDGHKVRPTGQKLGQRIKYISTNQMLDQHIKSQINSWWEVRLTDKKFDQQIKKFDKTNQKLNQQLKDQQIIS